MLQLLVRNRGRVVTAQHSSPGCVWGDETAIGGDRVKFGVLRLCRKLREAAGPQAPDPIEAVRGAGYVSPPETESVENGPRSRRAGPEYPGRTSRSGLNRAGATVGQPGRSGSCAGPRATSSACGTRPASSAPATTGPGASWSRCTPSSSRSPTSRSSS
ncbi:MULTISPECIES: winged helix-turn-helix domain-containing protein [unclassified Streptomyces]|uniref:winged helix-turn-helix domain-containing protein n=1 Tax=unclassified Streptomyces TaxID=2593676 RepID=UPI001F283F87|nr:MULTISPECIES: winged helix-turn-helix domain-containing protein [unclassified Streptomyces]